MGTFPQDEKSLLIEEEFECLSCHHIGKESRDHQSPLLVNVAPSVAQALFNHVEELEKFCGQCSRNELHKKITSYNTNAATSYIVIKSLREAPRAKYKQTEVTKFLDMGSDTFIASSVITHEGRSIHSGHYTIKHYEPMNNVWNLVNDDKQILATALQPLVGYCYLYTKLKSTSALHQNNREMYMEVQEQLREQQHMQEQQDMPNQNEDVPAKANLSEAAKKRLEKEKDKEVRCSEKTMHNIKNLMLKRLEGVHNSNCNESNSAVCFENNPMIKESKLFFKKLNENFKLPEQPCQICMESYIGMRLVRPRDGSKVCQRCYNEKQSNKQHMDFIPTFSEANDMWFGIQPEIMKYLTHIEQAVIKRVTPLFVLYCRKVFLINNVVNDKGLRISQ